MTYKVFVGNLSFKTKAEELAAEFSTAGKVVGANIIARGPRSLGYGFVEMETEEDAHKAVALLNKKSIDSREINVEVAKPRDDSKVAERRQAPEGGDQAPPRRGRGGRGGRGGVRGGRGRGGRGGGRGGRGPRAEVGTAGEATPANQGENNDNNSTNNNVDGANQAPPRRRYRARSQTGENSGAQGDAGAVAPPRGGGRGGARGGRGRGGRFPRAPREADNRTPSPTTLFVANLPFSLDDNGLQELFKAQNPTKAHVVLNRNGRSKGFGFVEFANEQDQQAAVNAEKKTVETRELIVKVALTSDQKPEGQSPVAEKAAEAPEESKTN